MSQQWLTIQSFFSDLEVLRAIDDLSIFLKQDTAGIHDRQRAELAQQARRTIAIYTGGRRIATIGLETSLM